jgi:hypothetical protein
VVEWQVGQRELVVNVADPKQSVYIYNCSDCVVQVSSPMPCIAPSSVHINVCECGTTCHIM